MGPFEGDPAFMFFHLFFSFFLFLLCTFVA